MTDPEICAAVRQHYGLAVRAVERIDRGSAALFKLYGSEAAFILKVFQPKFRADHSAGIYSRANTGKGLLFQKGAARLRQTAGANCKCLRALPLR